MEYSKEILVKYFEEYFGKKYLYKPYYKKKPLLDFPNKNIEQHILKLRIRSGRVTRCFDTFSMYQGDTVDWTCLPAGIYNISVNLPCAYLACFELPNLKYYKLLTSIGHNYVCTGRAINTSKNFEFKNPVVLVIWGGSAQIKLIKMYEFDYTIPTSKNKIKDKKSDNTSINTHKKQITQKPIGSFPKSSNTQKQHIVKQQFAKKIAINSTSNNNNYAIRHVSIYVLLFIILLISLFAIFR